MKFRLVAIGSAVVGALIAAAISQAVIGLGIVANVMLGATGGFYLARFLFRLRQHDNRVEQAEAEAKAGREADEAPQPTLRGM